MAEVADDTGGFPGGGEAVAGFSFAEAEDEAVHPRQKAADLAEGRAEGDGEGFFPGNGGGGGGNEFFVIGGFLGKQGRVRGIKPVFDEVGGIGGEGSGEFAVEELDLGNELDIAEALPGAQ